MPDGFAYAKTSIWLEVQKLGVKMNIVGVPFDNDKGKWNLTWLNTEAGWLENTAYPTHAGNSAITSHVTLANGLPGPFARLSTLSYGDQIVVHLDGQKYIYEVRDTKRVRPDAVNSVLKHEEHPWLTLITCQSYNEKANEYTYRTVVRAVLVKVIPE
jgi:LPXTG-site transpeptidase (sortase) family protein